MSFASKSCGIMFLMDISHDSGTVIMMKNRHRGVPSMISVLSVLDCYTMSKPSAAVPSRHLFVLQLPLQLVVTLVHLHRFQRICTVLGLTILQVASPASTWGHLPFVYSSEWFGLKIDDDG